MDEGIFRIQLNVPAKFGRRIVSTALNSLGYEQIINDKSLTGIAIDKDGTLLIRPTSEVADEASLLNLLSSSPVNICYVMNTYKESCFTPNIPDFKKGYTLLDILGEATPKKYYLEYV